MKTIRVLVTNMDQIAPAPADRLHYGGGIVEKHKTFCGGCCTFTAYILFILYFVFQAQRIANRENPLVSSQLRVYTAEDHPEIPLNKWGGFYLAFEKGRSHHEIDQ